MHLAAAKVSGTKSSERTQLPRSRTRGFDLPRQAQLRVEPLRVVVIWWFIRSTQRKTDVARCCISRADRISPQVCIQWCDRPKSPRQGFDQEIGCLKVRVEVSSNSRYKASTTACDSSVTPKPSPHDACDPSSLRFFPHAQVYRAENEENGIAQMPDYPQGSSSGSAWRVEASFGADHVKQSTDDLLLGPEGQTGTAVRCLKMFDNGRAITNHLTSGVTSVGMVGSFPLGAPPP